MPEEEFKRQEHTLKDLVLRRNMVAKMLRAIPDEPLTMSVLHILIIENARADPNVLMDNLHHMHEVYDIINQPSPVADNQNPESKH